MPKRENATFSMRGGPFDYLVLVCLAWRSVENGSHAAALIAIKNSFGELSDL